MNICHDLPVALTTLSCHVEMFRAVGLFGLVLYVPLLIPFALALIAIGSRRKPKRAAWRYDHVSRRDIGRRF